ncbi:MAG: YihY/virulence factor BrkB family protein [Chthoniobacteraceae bacterium]
MHLQTFTGNRVVKLLKATFDDWMEDHALRLSAALAYYSIFSIAPLLVIAMSVAGLVLGEEAVRGQLAQQLQSYIGAQAAEGVQAMIKSASKPSDGWLGAGIGFATLMLGAAAIFGQLQDALNTIWEVKAKGGGGVWGFLRARLLNFGMVLVIGFLLLTSLLLTTALAALNGYFEQLIGLPPFVGLLLGFVLSFGVVTVLFAFIFKVLPDAQIEWRHVWIGAAVTAFLFELGKLGLSFYLGRASTASSFGAAGSVVLLLLWVYYASCILLFGAEFTQVYAREAGPQIKPVAGAVPVTAEARAQQGMVPSAVIQADPHPPKPLIIPVAATPAGVSPLGALLAVTGGAFLVGLLIRRRTEAGEPPVTRIREGFADLGGQAVGKMGDLFKRARRDVARRIG